ncbi:hepatitis A virus cellular receptor 1 homolog [Takifugu flavidus]|uniref:Hepatitis A virus cellular receptor 2 n=1 Tax=Takifugu flavidus TaxID=433684 RepID=A0A5C6P606_9TELE|nr:hepatitis A virus cellular receptor 1 homolog [Takifugu flavidus]TWW75244.1 Hepatitis A virus cellular receptor 2 [Takifugu flavidus]
MLPLLRCAFIAVFVLTECVSTETVVGFAGRKVRLPCRTQAAGQGGLEVCWGRGEPSVFNCHNAVINAVGNRVTYRKSYRYSVSSSSSSLSILSSRVADTGYYHCRVQLPGLFNDQIATIHLIIIHPRYWVSPTTEVSLLRDDTSTEILNAPNMTLQYGFTGESGDNSTGPMVARVQSSIKQERANSLLGFIGNTVRASFIVFIPALLLTAAYRFCGTNRRANTDRWLSQTEEENTV